MLCSCEAVPSGQIGVIGNTERLGRVVCNPRHLRKNGELKPGLFPITHIQKMALSLMRLDQCDETEAKLQADHVAQSGTGKDEAVGYSIASAGALRDLVDDAGLRLLCVKDDPLVLDRDGVSNPYHALAGSSLFHNDADIVEIKTKLMAAFSGLVPF